MLQRILIGSQKDEAIMKGLGARGDPSMMATLKQRYEEKYEAQKKNKGGFETCPYVLRKTKPLLIILLFLFSK